MADTELQNLTELTTFDADDPLYTIDDPGGTPASRKIRSRAIGASYVGWSPDWGVAQGTANYYYATRTAIGTGNLRNNDLIVTPVYIPRRLAATTLAIVCVTPGTGTGLVRLGIWQSGGNYGPGNLVAEGGAAINIGSGGAGAGIQTATISATLEPGLYWTGCLCSVTATAPVVDTTSQAYSFGQLQWTGSALSAVFNWHRSMTYGALGNEGANTFAHDLAQSIPPIVMVR